MRSHLPNLAAQNPVDGFGIRLVPFMFTCLPEGMIDSDTLLTSAKLRNIGPATLADFNVLGITTIGELAQQDADTLYLRICEENSAPP
jgi:hypothetical protein